MSEKSEEPAGRAQGVFAPIERLAFAIIGPILGYLFSKENPNWVIEMVLIISIVGTFACWLAVAILRPNLLFNDEEKRLAAEEAVRLEKEKDDEKRYQKKALATTQEEVKSTKRLTRETFNKMEEL